MPGPSDDVQHPASGVGEPGTVGVERPVPPRSTQPTTTSVPPPAPPIGPSGGHDDPSGGHDGLEQLHELEQLLDAAAQQLHDLSDDTPGGVTGEVTGEVTGTAGSGAALGPGVSGPGGEASENRSIRHTRALLARRDAEDLDSQLSAVRQGVRLALERAQRSTTASRQARQARHQAPGSVGVKPVGAHLARVLDQAARRLLAQRDQDHDEGLDRTLALVVAGAIATIPHVERAGVSWLDPDRVVRSRAPSDVVAAELDEMQNTLGEGPCRDAIYERGHLLIDDLATDDQRWPRFVPAARERGVASILSFPLFAADDGTAGALNLYTAQPRVFDRDSIDTASLFASHAALALHGARRAGQLNTALRSRDVIGQAKGILIERFALTEEQAFTLLVESSQTTNMKLRDVAEWTLTETVHAHTSTPSGTRRGTAPGAV